MTTFHPFHKDRISREDPDPKHIENDLQLISIANRKQFDDEGWDQLQNRCYTKAGKSIIHLIEMRKYRSEESRSGML